MYSMQGSSSDVHVLHHSVFQVLYQCEADNRQGLLCKLHMVFSCIAKFQVQYEFLMKYAPPIIHVHGSFYFARAGRTCPPKPGCFCLYHDWLCTSRYSQVVSGSSAIEIVSRSCVVRNGSACGPF